MATDDNSVAGLLRSRDGGVTFQAIPSPPHIRALSERAGVVYAATDNFGDGYAAGRSMDQGDTWEALVSYDAVRGILPCVKAACQDSCAVQVQLTLWTDQVCSAEVPLSPHGAGGLGGGGASAVGGAPGQGGRGGASPPTASGAGGCGCALTSGRAPTSGLALAVGLLVLTRRRRF
jgi:hypothetical protein